MGKAEDWLLFFEERESLDLAVIAESIEQGELIAILAD
jgi:hypothetical protein